MKSKKPAIALSASAAVVYLKPDVISLDEVRREAARKKRQAAIERLLKFAERLP